MDKFETIEGPDGHTQYHFDDGTICDRAPGGPITCRMGEGAKAGHYLAVVAAQLAGKEAPTPTFTAQDVQQIVAAEVAKAMKAAQPAPAEKTETPAV